MSICVADFTSSDIMMKKDFVCYVKIMNMNVIIIDIK